MGGDIPHVLTFTPLLTYVRPLLRARSLSVPVLASLKTLALKAMSRSEAHIDSWVCQLGYRHHGLHIWVLYAAVRSRAYSVLGMTISSNVTSIVASGEIPWTFALLAESKLTVSYLYLDSTLCLLRAEGV